MFRGRRYWKKQFDVVMKTNAMFSSRNNELAKENVRLQNLLHQKVNELIDALDKVTELETEVEELKAYGTHRCENCKYECVIDKLNDPPCDDCGTMLVSRWEPKEEVKQTPGEDTDESDEYPEMIFLDLDDPAAE